MPVPPEICDKECHLKRIHLYLFYSVFLGSLLLLALIHFVMFLSSRRRIKYEAREYATRKLEFVTLGISDLFPNEKENEGENGNMMEDENFQFELKHAVEGMSSPLEPSTSSSSALNRMMTMNGIGTFPLQRIDEESIVIPRSPTPLNHCSSSSSNASTLRGRTVMGALQEPVIVTVATVSALFQEQHEVNEPSDQQQRRTITMRNDSGDEAGNWGQGIDHRGGSIHAKSQMLDVRMGGAKGGFLKSHRGEQPLKEGALSTDAIFPANEVGGIYET